MKTQIIIVLLAFLGLCVSACLIYFHFNIDNAYEVLTKMHTSGLTTFFGIPIAILGAITYTLIVGTALVSESKRSASLGIYLLSLIGLFVLACQTLGSMHKFKSVCPLHATSAAIMAIIFIIAAGIPKKRRQP